MADYRDADKNLLVNFKEEELHLVLQLYIKYLLMLCHSYSEVRCLRCQEESLLQMFAKAAARARNALVAAILYNPVYSPFCE